ncbi:phosphoglycolate phosphatase [Alkalilacustris brevis]|uniref:phosphoglycolate phosphatase n=1 Tax=Alkalilacustris brevis TaxID=2026338 RepID=UPI000E0DDABD|nr:phosphoglycolate phosphatase [Alkalilacustris brevis]
MRPAVVFDLDGTLIDSAPDLHAAANAVLKAEGLAPLTLAQARGFVGNGAPVFVQRMMAARGLPEAPELHARLLARFLEHYEAGVQLTRPYPGAIEALRSLQAAGFRLGLCTNKPFGPTQAVLAHLKLSGLFGTVVGGDSLPRRKPDPAPLHHALAALGADGGAAAFFVGDSEVDAECAHAAGVPFALFTEGYRKSPAESLRPALAFDDYTALVSWLSQPR